MSTKPCFKCGVEKELNAFYKHPRMADGHLNKCKECTKRDVIRNRNGRIDYYREYDRKRGSRMTQNDNRAYRSANPAAYRAHNAVNYALRAGVLVKAPCMICGREDSHGHHDNYDRPLEVTWLCPPHHFERHKTL